jgi:hypothetical protein
VSAASQKPPPGWLTPASILVGSGIIALGLYFGLRARAPTAISPGAASPPSRSAEPSASDAPPSSESAAPPKRADAPAPPASVRPRSVAEADAAKAIESLRQTIKTRCFEPHKNDPGAPKSVKLNYSGGFDAQGVEVARGLSDTRGAYFAPVSKCARELPMDLKIPAPGVSISVEIPFEVP